MAAHPVKKQPVGDATPKPHSEGRPDYDRLFKGIVEDSQRDSAAYINRWSVPGGAE